MLRKNDERTNPAGVEIRGISSEVNPKGDGFWKKKEKHHDEASEYRRLKNRYESKPFHERNFGFFRFATVGSWASNVVSGITESAKIFAFMVGIVGSLAFGNVLAFVITLLAIIGIELLHRSIARSYFKEYVVNNGHSREQNANLLGMVLCLLISAALSIAGQFDVLRIVMHKPQMAEVKEMDMQDIQSVLSPIVADAKKRTENYYKRRNYKGRLASDDKFKYRQYADHAKAMEDSLMSVIMQVPTMNAKAKAEARKQYLADKALYETEIETKGLGLIFVTIPAILLMYLCLWFEEKYLMKKKDYLEEIYGTATEEEYINPIAITRPAVAVPINPTATGLDVQQLAQHLSMLLQQPQQHGLPNGQGENGTATDSSTNDVGFSSPSLFPEAQAKTKELLQYVATKKDDYPDDKYTVLHFSFKNGQPKRYTRDRVDWFVKHYEEKVAIAEEEEVGEETEVNRKSKLLYWLERQKELYQKLGVAVA